MVRLLSPSVFSLSLFLWSSTQYTHTCNAYNLLSLFQRNKNKKNALHPDRKIYDIQRFQFVYGFVGLEISFYQVYSCKTILSIIISHNEHYQLAVVAAALRSCQLFNKFKQTKSKRKSIESTTGASYIGPFNFRLFLWILFFLLYFYSEEIAQPLGLEAQFFVNLGSSDAVRFN